METKAKKLPKYKYMWSLGTKEDLNFKYILDYDSNRSDCYGECGDDYCRCTTIEPTLNKIDINNIVSYILGQKNCRVPISEFKEDLTYFEYGIYRLCICHQLYRDDSWSLNIDWGYYGQELESLTIIGNQFWQDLQVLYDLESNKRIEFLLNKEYQYVRPDILDKKWKLAKICIDNIRCPNLERKLIVKNTVSYYDESYQLPIGLFKLIKQSKPIYELIDGYNRYYNAKMLGQKEVEVIYCL